MSKGNDRREPVSRPLGAERTRAILSAYGANRGRWPAEERAAVEAALGGNNDLCEFCATEAELDAVLAHAPSAGPSAGLRARLIADFERFAERRSMKLRTRLARKLDATKEFVWPGAPWWKPAFAFSLSVVLGVSAALFVLAPLSEYDEGDQVPASLIGSPQAADLGVDD